MTFTIITHAYHYLDEGNLFSYGPFVKEMNIWLSHVDNGYVVAPVTKGKPGKIDLAYNRKPIKISKIPAISIKSPFQAFRALWYTPYIMFRIFQAMRKADHIHLRCPGNIGLLGCLVQVLFPKKPKTAKYAGNWDPHAEQPRSYRFQRWLLSNTFLSKNMKVLVYGEWPDQTKNIVPFFTASYVSSKIPTEPSFRASEPVRFLFVGGLTPGKQPEYVVDIVRSLLNHGLNCVLDIFGEGVNRAKLEAMIMEHGLEGKVRLHGNVPAETVEEAYKTSHFLTLPSKSEGWPKVVAEAMFWGCIPVVTPISCIPWMVNNGSRGILLTLDLDEDTNNLLKIMSDIERMKSMSKNAQKWSVQYTLDAFDNEIVKFVS